jgi:hypothetical protein
VKAAGFTGKQSSAAGKQSSAAGKQSSAAGKQSSAAGKQSSAAGKQSQGKTSAVPSGVSGEGVARKRAAHPRGAAAPVRQEAKTSAKGGPARPRATERDSDREAAFEPPRQRQGQGPAQHPPSKDRRKIGSSRDNIGRPTRAPRGAGGSRHRRKPVNGGKMFLLVVVFLVIGAAAGMGLQRVVDGAMGRSQSASDGARGAPVQATSTRAPAFTF